MRTRAFAAGVCSRRAVSLTIARFLEHPKSGLNYYTAVNYQYSIAQVSCAILRTFGINLHLL